MKRTEYVYERQMAVAYQDSKSGYGLSAMHALLNPKTGKCARRSPKRGCGQGPLNSASSESGYQSHWLVGEKAPTQTPEGALAA